MSRFSLDLLKRQMAEQAAKVRPTIPVGTVGRILACCLSSSSGKWNKKVSFSRDELEQFVLTCLDRHDSMPLDIKDLFHVDYTECGPRLHELDDIVHGICVTNYYFYVDGKFFPKEPTLIEMVKNKYEEQYPEIVSWIVTFKTSLKEKGNSHMDNTSYLDNSVASITQESESCAGAVTFSLERKEGTDEFLLYLVTKNISGPSYVYDKYPISKLLLTKLNELLLDYKIANHEGNILLSFDEKD